MLYSVFNKRKVQKKFASIHPGRRAASPPSPASFSSHDAVKIHGETNSRSLHSEAVAQSYTPQVQLDLNYRESYSEWFPADLLRSGARTPPERNASLQRGDGSAPSIAGTTVVDSRTGTPEISFTSSVDDILIIETAPGSGLSRELPPLPAADYDSDNQASLETNCNPSVSRKPTPTPIRIPDNHAGANIHIQRSACAGTSAGPSSYLPVPGSNGPSRPPSPGSDDLSSSISGTTLARALVASSFVFTNDSRGSRYRSGITRQDSATLPRGEHPLHGRMSARASSELWPDTGLRSSIPPVPPLPASAELSMRSRVDSTSGSRSRRSSYSGAGESRRASVESSYGSELGTSRRSSINGMPTREQVAVFSPISPITEAPSPAPSAPNTPTFVDHGSAGASSSSLTKSSSQSRSTNISESHLASSSSSMWSVEHRRLSTEPSRSSFDGRSERDETIKLPTLLIRASPLSPGPDSGTTASVYSVASYSRASISTAGTSVRSPYSASSPTNRMSRSHSDSSTHGHRGTGPHRSVTLLPIGERPHSVQVPQSPMSARTSSDSDLRRPFAMPSLLGSARVSGDTPVDSPDLLDMMFPVAPTVMARERSGRGRERTGSQLAPLDIAPGASDLPTPVLSSDTESLVHVSGHHQTFPETPYAFSPLLSAGIASPIPPPPPQLRGGVRALPRTMTLNRTGTAETKTRWGTREAFVRSTMAPAGVRAPPTPPSSVESVYGSSSGNSEHVVSATSDLSMRPMPVLSAIEESNHTPSNSPSPVPRSRSVSRTRSPSPGEVDPQRDDDANVISFTTSNEASMSSVSHGTSTHGDSPPPAYMSMQEAVASGLPPTAHLQAESADDREQPSRQSSLRSNGTHSSYRSSVAKPGRSLTLSPLPSPPPSAPPVPASPMPPSPMPSIEEHSMAEQAPPPPYVEEVQRPTISVAAPPAPSFVAPAVPSRVATPELQIPKRNARTRPPLPIGPRRPLVSTRSRTGSVSSSISNPSGPGSMRRPSVPTLSASSPRFQTTPVKFRGLTKEAAEWTFSSQQLQQLVSTAIRQTADVSAIRLLPLDTLNTALPEEMDRLEALSAELRTNYKLNVRRRRMILGSLASMVDGSEPSESGAAGRMVEELSEITDNLDQISEELYDVTMQLGQLTHLRDVHSSSALIMALHKLNKSLKKHLEEGQKLREQVTTLEAERDEAWKQAQEVAQDFDDLAERADQTTPSAREASTSRRSSRVVVARKNSARAARAGLRSSMHRRSQRSSVSSGHQTNMSPSPALWSAQITDIPPVPPIPLRSLGILTDLPTSQTAMMSESPSSEFRAMTEAQKELCDMLGISMDDLKTHQPSRRQSMSAACGGRTPIPISPSRTRRNSDSLTFAQSTPASAQGLFRI